MIDIPQMFFPLFGGKKWSKKPPRSKHGPFARTGLRTIGYGPCRADRAPRPRGPTAPCVGESGGACAAGHGVCGRAGLVVVIALVGGVRSFTDVLSTFWRQKVVQVFPGCLLAARGRATRLRRCCGAYRAGALRAPCALHPRGIPPARRRTQHGSTCGKKPPRSKHGLCSVYCLVVLLHAVPR